MTPRESNTTASQKVRRPRSTRQRVHLYVRVFLIMCVVTAPALITRTDQVRWARLTKNAVGSPDRALPSSAVSPGDRALLANYLAHRSPDIDALLPAGAGGTVYVRSLPDVRGIAFSRANSIVISLEDGAVPTLHAIEIHERAHLAQAQLSEIARAILTTLPAPASGSYAATNDQEHFAEMASEAWRLLQSAGDDFSAETPPETLARVEAQVPGTAGFVLYFLQHPSFATLESAPALRDAASASIAPARDQWEQLYAALDARRQPDGTLKAWPVPTMREWVDRHRAELRAQGTVLGQVYAFAFLPSALLLRVMGA